jgi:hypothetical protein
LSHQSNQCGVAAQLQRTAFVVCRESGAPQARGNRESSLYFGSIGFTGRSLAAEIQNFRKGSSLDIGCKERSTRRLASANLTASIADQQENAGHGYRDHRVKKFS